MPIDNTIEKIIKSDISLKTKFNIINTFSKFDIRVNQGKRQTLHLEALILEIFNGVMSFISISIFII